MASPFTFNAPLPWMTTSNPMLQFYYHGFPGLANAYGQDYQNALNLNSAMYNNIGLGYQNTLNQMYNGQQSIGAGYNALYGNVLGKIANIGQAQRQAIADAYAQQQGAGTQSMISRGLGNTTVTDAMNRGLLYDKSKADINLSDQLAQLQAGYMSQLGLATLGNADQSNQQNTAESNRMLDWLNTIRASYPDVGAYNALAQQAGQANAAANMNPLPGGAGGAGGLGGGGVPSGGGFQGIPQGMGGGAGGSSGGAGGAGGQGGGPGTGGLNDPSNPANVTNPSSPWYNNPYAATMLGLNGLRPKPGQQPPGNGAGVAGGPGPGPGMYDLPGPFGENPGDIIPGIQNLPFGIPGSIGGGPNVQPMPPGNPGAAPPANMPPMQPMKPGPTFPSVYPAGGNQIQSQPSAPKPMIDNIDFMPIGSFPGIGNTQQGAGKPMGLAPEAAVMSGGIQPPANTQPLGIPSSPQAPLMMGSRPSMFGGPGTGMRSSGAGPGAGSTPIAPQSGALSPASPAASSGFGMPYQSPMMQGMPATPTTPSYGTRPYSAPTPMGNYGQPAGAPGSPMMRPPQAGGFLGAPVGGGLAGGYGTKPYQPPMPGAGVPSVGTPGATPPTIQPNSGWQGDVANHTSPWLGWVPDPTAPNTYHPLSQAGALMPQNSPSLWAPVPSRPDLPSWGPSPGATWNYPQGFKPGTSYPGGFAG